MKITQAYAHLERVTVVLSQREIEDMVIKALEATHELHATALWANKPLIEWADTEDDKIEVTVIFVAETKEP